MSTGNNTGLVMLDLQKAFDTVDHVILCKKLRAMGITSVDWFKSYLSCRTQIVNVNQVDSDPLNVSCGVPQGSILGPLLFLCYVNDMASSVDCNFYSMLMIAPFWYQRGTQITLQTSLVKNLSLVVNG